jgi:hypothetical protein
LDEAAGQSVYCALVHGAVRVDLQWRLVDPCFSFPLDDERLWEGMRSVSLAGAAVRSFAPEVLLLMLCAHGAKHAWQRLLWVCDVAELIRAHPAIDWEKAKDHASAAGGRRMLALGLCLARELLETPLPDDVSRDIASDCVVMSLVAQVLSGFGSRTPQCLDDGRKSAFLVMVRERFRDRVRRYPGLGLHVVLRLRRLIGTRGRVPPGEATAAPGPASPER